MAFKLRKVVGSGAPQTILTNTAIHEAIIHSMVAYNNTGVEKIFTVNVDNVTMLSEKIKAGGVFRLSDKLNIEPSASVSISAPIGVEVIVNFVQQAIDITAALTSAQQVVSSAETNATDLIAAASAQVDLASAQANIAADQAALAANYVTEAGVAASSANNRGAWSNLTGSLTLPASVTHDWSIWVLNVDLLDVTLSEPTLTNTDWTKVNSDIGSLSGGSASTIFGTSDITISGGNA